MDVADFVEVSSPTIKFGVVLPGFICERDLEVTNRSNENLILRSAVICNNSEFDEHDEYVYSMRKAHIHE